ncbi:MAG: hypothetical protein AB7E52_00570 [Bdellovibrionales bacterium]
MFRLFLSKDAGVILEPFSEKVVALCYCRKRLYLFAAEQIHALSLSSKDANLITICSSFGFGSSPLLKRDYEWSHVVTHYRSS